MLFDSPLTLFVLALPPIVAVVFIVFIWLKREPVAQPSIVAAIPLGLAPVTLLLSQSAVILISTFQQIATQQSAGIHAVIRGMLRSQQPIIWGILDFTICLSIIFLFIALLNALRGRDEEQDDAQLHMHAYISLPALIFTVLILISILLIVYFQYSTVDLVMKIVDPHRTKELGIDISTFNPAAYASRISYQLMAIAALSFCLFFASLIAGALCLFWRQKMHSREGFAFIFVLATLAVCGITLLEEFSFVNYLQNLH
jgi:hypothetical protein